MSSLTRPILAFVHVPKTAGSTVNDHMSRSGMEGATHVEGWLSEPTLNAQKLARLEWVSGHIPIWEFRKWVADHSSRHVRFFTTVREPVKQLMSHYNWLIEIFHRGKEFYSNHPARIREISETIRASDNNDPDVIVNNLKLFSGLFLNQQCRLVLGCLPTTHTDDELSERLQVYERVVSERGLPSFIREISGLDYDDANRKNVSPYHFDKAVFQNETLRSFIRHHHAADFALYRYIDRITG